MSVMDVIASRRSIKNFTDRAITNEEIERLLGAVCCAPNHRMTEPWRFYVLGPEGRAAYGKALGMRKAKRVEDPEAAQAVISLVSVSVEVGAIPEEMAKGARGCFAMGAEAIA